jgi:cell division initiation protein
MKIGPVDIRNHTFSRKMRGVDEAEVRAYLDLAADRLEEVMVEADDLRGRIGHLEAQLEEYGTIEASLKSSLISAKQIADEKLASAEKEARIILKNAEVDAEKVVVGARGELARLRADVDDLRRQKLTYVERFRALLRSQMNILEASVDVLDPDILDSDEEGRAVRDVIGGGKRRPANPVGSMEKNAPDPLGQYLGEQGLFSQEAKERAPGEGG